jgi:hypothetical protein
MGGTVPSDRDTMLLVWSTQTGDTRGGRMAATEPRIPIYSLGLGDIERALSRFEEQFASRTGESLSSDEFYARYERGEFDNPFGIAWATLVEVSRTVDLSARLAAGVP